MKIRALFQHRLAYYLNEQFRTIVPFILCVLLNVVNVIQMSSRIETLCEQLKIFTVEIFEYFVISHLKRS